MAGHNLIVSGDQQAALATAYSLLEQMGFTVTRSGDWAAVAERGSQVGSMLLGAFAGKKGRHVKLEISGSSDANGNLVITFLQAFAGASGGAMGVVQANQIYNEVYDTCASAFISTGVLLHREAIK